MILPPNHCRVPLPSSSIQRLGVISDRSRNSHGDLGFTLVEILIVVVVLGILAAIVVPQFATASESAQRTAFSSELRVMVETAQRYEAASGDWPGDSSSGELPPELAEYFTSDPFSDPTPIGGVWDFERDSFSVRAAVGVHFEDPSHAKDAAFMQDVDLMIDDGSLTTGSFRQIADDRYYIILSD